MLHVTRESGGMFCNCGQKMGMIVTVEIDGKSQTRLKTEAGLAYFLSMECGKCGAPFHFRASDVSYEKMIKAIEKNVETKPPD